MVPLDRIKEWLLTLDEVQVCDLLDISTEELVYRFEDIIIKKQRHLAREMEVAFEPMEDLNFD